MQVVLVLVLAIVGFLFMPVIAAFLGAIAGWVVGLFFGHTIFAVLAAFGVNTAAISMWQLGAALAFIGSFFRASVNK